jgi:hypothetical protein
VPVGFRSFERVIPPVVLNDVIVCFGMRPEESLSSLLDKYQEKGFSLRQITATSVHSRDRISERLNEAGVQLRPHNPARRRALNLAESMELMQNMRSKGKTYREIAEELINQKVRSKLGKTQWHPMMVKRLILKHKIDYCTNLCCSDT